MILRKKAGNNPLDKYGAVYLDAKGNSVHGLSTEGKKVLGILLSAMEGKEPREIYGAIC